ncbi:MAG: aminodeoxychorismate synthase component I [Ignavibacteriaceae bacterium]|nr:aminodeoxychorismate synthase component I [Ignavibacteriaceae bacterium]
MELIKILNKVASNTNSAFFFTPPFYEESFSFLFLNPFKVINIYSNHNLEKKLQEVDQLNKEGYSSYSIIKYEAGYLFEKKLQPYLQGNEKLIQFFFFKPKDVIKLNSSSLNIADNKIRNYAIKNFRLNNTKSEFKKNIHKIKKYIAQGDTYQVNYTVKGIFNFQGDVTDLFLKLIFNQSARYSAFINTGDSFILSISPELFFEVDGRKISTKPMKGTVRRGFDNQSDNMIKYNLATSEKNCAENVMIVDLLRNDLGRISQFGSIKVESLFEVEKYESLFQMVSEISSKLRKQITFSEIIKNIFPCGSITGAPKIRTMEIINELEKEPRGIYTGSIGFIHKKKKVFNVGIRTLVINKKSHKGEIGLGSGIVWDSDVDQEYQETLLKSKFLTNPESEFELFETMLLENGKIFLLEDHLNRLNSSSSFFLFRYNEKKIHKVLEKEISKFHNHSKQKIKLILNKWGKIKVEVSPAVIPPKEINIINSKKIIITDNKYQYFKTTNRKLYDRENYYYSKKGFFDVIYFNEKNELAEGSITNIFLRFGESLVTPPVNSGILGGIYRKFLLHRDSNIQERTLFFEDLITADEIILTNALKGEIKVNRLYLNETEFKKFG